MKKIVFLFAFFTAPAFADTPWPSGLVSELLNAAEAGNRSAIYSLVAGAPQVFPESDDIMNSYIDAEQFDLQRLNGTGDDALVFSLGITYKRIYAEPEASIFYCKWTQRALDLHRTLPPPTQEQDSDLSTRWYTVKYSFDEAKKLLSPERKQACQEAANDWKLKP